jgi:outer membrane protein TolC
MIVFAIALMSVSVVAPSAHGQQRLPAVSGPTLLPSVKTAEASKPSVATEAPSLDWWSDRVTGSVLDEPRWVTFDLQTVLVDTLSSSPRINSVSHRTSIALERIVQQDAAFDPSLLLEKRVGRTNDPVGNSLETGGPPRLIEESFTSRSGIQRTGRHGSEVILSQELGLLSSNSLFFAPEDQGNARLSLSLTQPLLRRGGQVYNERLLIQARIDSNVSWQDMRAVVEQRVADVIKAYWRLHELRCNSIQQDELLKRGERIEEILIGRNDFDSSRIEMAKARQRVARRIDRQVQIRAEIEKQQIELATLVGSDTLAEAGGNLEMIPRSSPLYPDFDIELRDAVLQGIENRPEVRAAIEELESAALAIRVTRAELLPELTAVVDTYLMGLNGSNDVFGSFVDQFARGGPGVSAGLRYDLPIGRRAARARHREAHHLYQQRSEELREAMQLTRADIETALVSMRTAITQQQTKRRLLMTAIEEETVLTRRWEMMGGDGAAVGTVLENLLDAQQRRTDAEREWTAAQIRYRTSLVDLQRAMGTLLIGEGIEPITDCGDSSIEFIHTQSARQPTAVGNLPQLTEQQFEWLINEEVNP